MLLVFPKFDMFVWLLWGRLSGFYTLSRRRDVSEAFAGILYSSLKFTAIGYVMLFILLVNYYFGKV